MRAKYSKFISQLSILILLVCGFSLPLLSQGDESASAQSVLSTSSPLHESNIVGNLAGSFSVDQEGNAAYDISLKASPGTAGMTPSLSIHYDSSGGNGLMGMGFNLQGLTAITRAPQNYAQNGKIHAVNFTSDDRFALNGQQLVAVSGSYGADNTEYRTYIDSQSRITSHASLGNGPQSFIVETKGGQTAYYGASDDSRVIENNDSTGTVISWLLTKIVDQSGNEIDYHYNQDTANGTNYPSEIDYTSNAKTGLTSYASVKFIYENRPDVILSYQAGTKFNVTQRLKEIQSYYKNDLVYDYKINYDMSPSTDRSRITSISQCDGSGECLRPLIFHWQTNEMGWTPASEAWNQNVPPFSCYYGPKSDGEADQGNLDCGVRFADMQGTGQMWMIQNSEKGTGVWKATPSGWQSTSDYNFSNYYFTLDGESQGTELADLTGKGYPDLIQMEANDGKPHYFRIQLNDGKGGWSDGSAFLTSVNDWAMVMGQGADSGMRFADFTGHGRADLIQGLYWQQSGPIENRAKVNTGSGWGGNGGLDAPTDFTKSQGLDDGTRLINLSGSGLPDLLQANDSRRTGWINAYGYGANPEAAGSANWISTGNTPNDFRFIIDSSYNDDKTHVEATRDAGGRAVDLLGDGLDDLIMSRDGSHQAWINTGKGFVPDSNYNPPNNIVTSQQKQDYRHTNWHTYSHDDGVELIDVTGSGLPAFLRCGSNEDGGCHAWLNEEGTWKPDDSYAPQTQITDDSGQDNGVRFVDLLGTGFVDMIVSHDKQIKTWMNKAQTKPDMLTDVQDALGDKLTIQYKPITDTSIYTKGHNAVYPNMDLQSPIYVVAQTHSDTDITPIPNVTTVSNKLTKLVNDTVTQHVTDYTYANAIMNHLGWGFLGFGSMTTKDETTGMTVTTTYSQDTLNHTQGMATGSVTQLANGTVLNKQSTTFDTKNFNNQYYLPYVKTSTEDAYDLDGTHLSTKTTTTTLDDFANPTEVLQTATDSTGIYTTDTTSKYINDTSNGHWWIGQLMISNVTASAPNTPSMIRATSYTYDPATGMLQSTTTYAGTPPSLRARHNLKFYDDNRFLTKTYKRDAYGNITETDITGSDIAPRTENVIYDDQNYFRFVKVQTNALGQQTTYTYDSDFGNVKTVTDANNQTITNAYDSFGRLQSTIHPDKTISQIQYQWSNNDVNAPKGSVYEIISTGTNSPTKISYHDELDREIGQAMQGFHGKWIWQLTNYDERGLIVGKTNPFYVGDQIYVTSNQYDLLGRVSQTVNTDNTTIIMGYNGYGTSTSNVLRESTIKTLNVRGNLIKSTNAQTINTTYQYNAFGNLTTVTDSENHSINTLYDNWGHKLETNDPDAGVWKYTYDMLGEMLTQTDPLGNQTSFQYDLLGRMIARTDPAGTSTWHYDGATNGIGKIDSENGVSNIIRQPTSLPYVVKQFITKPTSVQILRAAEDNLVSYSRTYTYDSLSRPEKVITTLNGQSYTQQTSYDANGKVDIVTDPNGIKTKNHYDDQGYLTSVSDPDSAVVYSTINAMDPQGHVTSVTRSNGLITSYTYDPTTTLLSEILTQPTQALAIQESLFPHDNKDNAADWHLKMADSHDRLEAAKNWFNSQDDSNNLPPPALATGAVQQLDYKYDRLGNAMIRSDAVLNVEDRFTYDTINRMAATQYIDNTHHTQSRKQYYYDHLGNITDMPGVGHYTYDPNNLPHAVRSIAPSYPTDHTETDNFAYDGAGEQTHADMQTTDGRIIRDITYTSFEVPKTITQSNDKTNTHAQVNFYYDANHNRFMQESVVTTQATGTIKTTIFYLGNEEVDTTIDTSGTHTTTKNFIGDTILVTQDDGTHHRYEILKDALGSTNAIVDENGNVVQRFHYEPFGEQQLESSANKQVDLSHSPHPSLLPKGAKGLEAESRTSITRYGFTGQEEIESGGINLIHMNGRLYDPHLGRFLSPDPTVQDPTNNQCLNRYSYCQNSPADYIDPTGFSFWSSLWKGAKQLFHDTGHAIGAALRNPVVGTLINIAAGAWAIASLGTGTPLTMWTWSICGHFAAAAAISGAVSYAQSGNIGLAFATAAFTMLNEYAWTATGMGLQGASYAEKVLAHGTTGAVLGAIEGSGFKNGFIAAAASQALSGPISGIDNGDETNIGIAERGAAAGLVGGTVAAATGGNFENGAMTSAMAQMYNDDGLDRAIQYAEAGADIVEGAAMDVLGAVAVPETAGTSAELDVLGTARIIKGVDEIATPYGVAAQDTSEAAIAAKNSIKNGAAVYRQGKFGVQETGDAQFWAPKSPLGEGGYAKDYGLPESNTSDWVMKANINSNFITRAAPGIGANSGGGIEAVTNPGGASIQWFHMR